MSLKFRNQIIKNPEGKIKYRKFSENGREHFHIGVWLDGPDEELDQVSKVELTLHPSFRNPVRSSENRANKFSITFWTWGMFDISARIHFQDGTVRESNYYLSYELPADNGGNYVEA